MENEDIKSMLAILKASKISIITGVEINIKEVKLTELVIDLMA